MSRKKTDAEDNQMTDEMFAIKALAFVAGNRRRMEGFLAVTGMELEDIAGRVADRDFQMALLDHLMQDERLLTAFAKQAGLDPAQVARARDRLAGVEGRSGI